MRSSLRSRVVPLLGATGVVTLLLGCGSRVEDRFARPAPTTGATTTGATTTGASTAPVPTTTTAGTTTSSLVEPTTPSPTTPTPTTPTPTTVGPVPTVFDEAAGTEAITATWLTFFAPSTSIDDRLALLENGEALRDAVALAMSNPLLSQALATVKQVTFESSGRAQVVYDIALSGTGAVVLPDAVGFAVVLDGTWKVAQATFCGLASLAVEGDVPGCD